MKYFAGLDVSLDETALCIVDNEGTIVREGKALSASALSLQGKIDRLHSPPPTARWLQPAHFIWRTL